MQRSEIEQTLADIEQAFESDEDATLAGRGFWKAVNTVKKDPELTEVFADRIAALDRTGFERWALLTIPLGIGTVIAFIATAFGLTLVGLAYDLDEPANGLFFLAGMFVCFTSLHSLGHLIVGRLFGIRFTHWFVGEIKRPQPGVKIDYGSYLRTAPTRRAWMHAAGAITSKAVPFLLLPAAFAADVPAWAIAALVLVGLGTITTDALFSVKSGDWKEFKRERAFAETEAS